MGDRRCRLAHRATRGGRARTRHFTSSRPGRQLGGQPARLEQRRLALSGAAGRGKEGRGACALGLGGRGGRAAGRRRAEQGAGHRSSGRSRAWSRAYRWGATVRDKVRAVRWEFPFPVRMWGVLWRAFFFSARASVRRTRPISVLV
jgi:hypothetical protein